MTPAKSRKVAIVMAGLSMAFTGCGLFHSTKNLSVKNERDSVYSTQSHQVKIDTGKTTVRETNDYSFLSPAVTLKSTLLATPAELIRKFSTGLTVLDTAMVRVALHYDSLSSSLSVTVDKKPEQVTLHQVKETEQRMGTTTISDTKSKVNVKNKNELATKETKPSFSWLIWLGCIVLGLFLLLGITEQLKLDSFVAKLFNRK